MAEMGSGDQNVKPPRSVLFNKIEDYMQFKVEQKKKKNTVILRNQKIKHSKLLQKFNFILRNYRLS